jgi:hypothetical protein
MNKFIDYLNSLNSASGDNENAIAENAKNDENNYYEKVLVEQALTLNIINEIQAEKPIIFFLTGHAGDGKTSILIQVLNKLGKYNAKEGIKESDTVILDSGRKLTYIKDISELKDGDPIQKFNQALKGLKDNESSIIVSNTGQLLSLLISKGIDRSKALDCLDSNEGFELPIDDNIVRFVNLALYDNSDFIREFLIKINNDELWAECVNCAKKRNCSIFMNHILIREHFEKVCTFIEYYYRWNVENNNKFTIRQIVSHISYGITGNLYCSEIKQKPNSNVYLYNNFANQFFGLKYDGGKLKKDPNAYNIKGVKELNKLGLDNKKLRIDYDLFVKEDFSVITELLRDFSKYLWSKYRQGNITDLSCLKAIKRMYLIFNCSSDKENQLLYEELYSRMFPIYLKIRKELIETKVKNEIKRIVLDALSRIMTGYSISKTNRLYITLKQPGEKVQNVQLVEGYFYTEDISIDTEIYKNKATGKDAWNLVLKFDNGRYTLSYALLSYLYEVSSGIIQTQLKPVLSQDLEKLKMKMKQNMKMVDQENVTLLVYTGSNLEPLKLIINNDSIECES